MDVGEKAIIEPTPMGITPLCPERGIQPVQGETRVSFQPFLDFSNRLPGFLGEHADHILAWLRSIVTDPEAEPRWVTIHHLLAHYQMVTKRIGYKFQPKQKQWELITDFVGCDGPMFLRTSRWFQSLLKSVAEFYKCSYICANSVPDGSFFVCWCRCVRLPISLRVLLGVEERIAHFPGQSIKVLKGHFSQRDSFISMSFP